MLATRDFQETGAAPQKAATCLGSLPTLKSSGLQRLEAFCLCFPSAVGFEEVVLYGRRLAVGTEEPANAGCAWPRVTHAYPMHPMAKPLTQPRRKRSGSSTQDQCSTVTTTSEPHSGGGLATSYSLTVHRLMLWGSQSAACLAAAQHAWKRGHLFKHCVFPSKVSTRVLLARTSCDIGPAQTSAGMPCETSGFCQAACRLRVHSPRGQKDWPGGIWAFYRPHHSFGLPSDKCLLEMGPKKSATPEQHLYTGKHADSSSDDLLDVVFAVETETEMYIPSTKPPKKMQETLAGEGRASDQDVQ